VATELLVWGAMAHLVADWLLQNEYLALNKTSLRHPAAYVHSGLHWAALTPVFGLQSAALLALSHLLIDTRVPLATWQRLIGQTRDGEMGVHVKIWADQVLHLACIAALALYRGGH
jgi:hypothetical protein